MTTWLLSFGWNWALVPVVVWLFRMFWEATREPSLRYIQHSTVSVARGLAVDDLKEAVFAEKLHRHMAYPSLEPEMPKLPCPMGVTSHLLTLVRREDAPPWRRRTETWLVTAEKAVRESDGALESGALHKRLLGMIEVAEARKIETEELTK